MARGQASGMILRWAWLPLLAVLAVALYRWPLAMLAVLAVSVVWATVQVYRESAVPTLDAINPPVDDDDGMGVFASVGGGPPPRAGRDARPWPPAGS
jgi:hypothetical protein